MTSALFVLPWECSPLALKNKPAVPVGYHTVGQQRGSSMSAVYSLSMRGLQQTLYSTDI